MAFSLSSLFGGEAPYTQQSSAIGNQQFLQGQIQNAQGGANVTTGGQGLIGAAGTAAGTGQDLTSLGVGGTLSMEQLLAGLGGGFAGAGSNLALGGAGGAGNTANLLAALGIPTGISGIGGAAGAAGSLAGTGAGITDPSLGGASGNAGLLNALGIGAAGQAGATSAGTLPLFMQGVGTEATGTLPAGGQAAVQQNLQQTTEQIKGQFAALGMSGSTAEESALANAQQQSLINQFTIAGQLGSQETQQALALGQLGNAQTSNALGGVQSAGGLNTTLASLGLGATSGAGGLSSQLANLGIGALGTGGNLNIGAAGVGTTLSGQGLGAAAQSGNLASSLSSLGFNYANLSSSDWANILQGGLSEMGLGGQELSGASSTYGQLAQLQFQEDTQLGQIVGKFFQGLGAGVGAGATGGVGAAASAAGPGLFNTLPGGAGTVAPSFFGSSGTISSGQ
jgi:hypothetical protein